MTQVTYSHVIHQSDLNEVVNLLRELSPFPEKVILKLMDSKRISSNSDLSGYYADELSKVNPHLTEYSPTVKIFANGNGDNTKNLSLNDESAAVLIKWLKNNFPNCEGLI